MNDVRTIERVLLAYVHEHHLLPAPVDGETDLIESGQLDSLVVMDLVGFVHVDLRHGDVAPGDLPGQPAERTAVGTICGSPLAGVRRGRLRARVAPREPLRTLEPGDVTALDKRALRASEISFINHQYLHGCHGTSDPTMIWGTDIDTEALLAFVKQSNEPAEVVISVTHVLIKAVAAALARFPQLNCRIVGGRIYRFRDVNVRIVSFDRKTSDVDILTLPQADRASLHDIGRFLWDHQLQLATGRYVDRLDKAMLGRWCPAGCGRRRSGCSGGSSEISACPASGGLTAISIRRWWSTTWRLQRTPMRMYKPSKFLDETSLLSVTIGRIEEMPVVRDGQVVARLLLHCSSGRPPRDGFPAPLSFCRQATRIARKPQVLGGAIRTSVPLPKQAA